MLTCHVCKGTKEVNKTTPSGKPCCAACVAKVENALLYSHNACRDAPKK